MNLFLSPASLVLAFFTMMLCNSSYAQRSPAADSLLQLLESSKQDTTRVQLLNELAWEQLGNDPSQALANSIKAMQLARTLGNKPGLRKSTYGAGLASHRLGNYREAIGYFNESLRVSRQENNKLATAIVYTGLAEVFNSQGNFDKALTHDFAALKIFRELREEARAGNALSFIGITYISKGDYVQALEYLLQALRLAEKRGDRQMIAYGSNDLGTVFEAQGNLVKAREYFLKSLRWSEKNNKDLMTVNLVNLGIVHYRLKQYDRALAYYQQALQIREQVLKDQAGIRSVLNNIGNVYYDQGQLGKAKAAYTKALAIARKIDHREGIATAMISLARIYKEQKQYATALPLATEGVARAEKIGIKEETKDGYEVLSALQEAMGEHRQALQNYKRFVQYKDSLAGEATTNKINELYARFETQQKEQQINVLSQHADIDRLQLQQQRLYLAGLLVLVAVLAGLGYGFLRHNKLRHQQKTVELEQKLLRSQLNPHFIFNALTAIQQFMYRHSAAEAGRYLAKFAKLMRLILENSRLEYITLQKEIQTLEHYLELQRLRFGDKFDYQIHVDPGLDPEEVTVPPMFAQPLVENSLEHGILHKSERGLVQVRYHKQGDQVVLEVEDNGVGRQKAGELAAVHRREHVSLATQITQERLKLFNRRRNRKVKMKVEDLLDQHQTVLGTKATFAIPFKVEST
jgi:tetratricopeptide (TPR) repeat protein